MSTLQILFFITAALGYSQLTYSSTAPKTPVRIRTSIIHKAPNIKEERQAVIAKKRNHDAITNAPIARATASILVHVQENHQIPDDGSFCVQTILPRKLFLE